MGVLDGRRIVVTGVAGELGAGAVRVFAGEGARVAALDADAEAARGVAEKASALGATVSAHSYDAQGATIGEAIERAAAELGGIDVLAHLVSPEGNVPAEEITDEDWDGVVKANLRSLRVSNQRAFRLMRHAGGGRIINHAHPAGHQAQHGQAHIAALSAAVMVWSRVAAQGWGQYGILVNNFVSNRFGDLERQALPLLVFLASDAATLTRQDFGY